MATPNNEHRKDQRLGIEEMDTIYDRFVAPLEREHWGEFVAVSKDGRIILGPNDREVFFKAKDAFGPGNFLFKIGPRAVGRI